MLRMYWTIYPGDTVDQCLCCGRTAEPDSYFCSEECDVSYTKYCNEMSAELEADTLLP